MAQNLELDPGLQDVKTEELDLDPDIIEYGELGSELDEPIKQEIDTESETEPAVVGIKVEPHCDETPCTSQEPSKPIALFFKLMPETVGNDHGLDERRLQLAVLQSDQMKIRIKHNDVTQLDVCSYKTHSDIDNKEYACVLCDVKFTDKNSLLVHKWAHTGIKLYACDICDFSGSYKRDLVVHRRTHTGEKPYSCNDCSYKGSSKNNLTKHSRIHTMKNEISCPFCDIKFTDRKQLLAHKWTHTGICCFVCDECDYKCAYKSNLVAHKRTHN